MTRARFWWWELVLGVGALLIDFACRHLPPPFTAADEATLAAGIAGRIEGERESAVLRRALRERGRYRTHNGNHRMGG